MLKLTIGVSKDVEGLEIDITLPQKETGKASVKEGIDAFTVDALKIVKAFCDGCLSEIEKDDND